MDKYCYLNGKILLEKDAMVSIFDIGLLRGYGIYEALTTHNKKPFMLADHLVRFRNAAKGMDLQVIETDDEISNIIQNLIQKNGFAESNIKFILTGGNTINAISYDIDKPTFYIFIEEFKAVPESFLQNGCSVITYEHQRQYAELKTTNYITAVIIQQLIREKEVIEALYISNGKVLECSTSNFFIVKEGKLITPKENILKGITRKVVIDLALKNNINVEERDISVDELFSADEAFLTASFKEIVPIVIIDDKEVSKKILNLFKNFTSSY